MCTKMVIEALNLNAKKRVRHVPGHSYTYDTDIKKKSFIFVKANFSSRNDAHNVLFNVNKRLQNSIVVYFYFYE